MDSSAGFRSPDPYTDGPFDFNATATWFCVFKPEPKSMQTLFDKESGYSFIWQLYQGGIGNNITLYDTQNWKRSADFQYTDGLWQIMEMRFDDGSGRK